MKLVPALEYEKLRTDKESWCKMMLHKDGKFYHVYEWSAYWHTTNHITYDRRFSAVRSS